MKILLREYDGKEYVWVTAKYNGEKFVVNDKTVDEWKIVSVINDNRKNYIKCSSCGKIFPKKGKQFSKHKAEAETDAPCMKCERLRINERSACIRKFVPCDDGTYTMKQETHVDLMCRYSTWNSYNINSDYVKQLCKFRQCSTAYTMEIADTFTIWPGIFDHIITVDKILDHGYEAISYYDENMTDYLMDSRLGISVYINKLGIVDRFYISNRDEDRTVWYSKKYNLLFTNDENGHYTIYCSDQDNETLKYIANIYK